MGANKFTYICKICNFESTSVREHLKHLNSEKHKVKRELKCKELKMKKIADAEIEEILINLENSV